MKPSTPLPGIRLELPGRTPIVFHRVLLDFNGTLACDGRLLPGVADWLRRLARRIEVEVLTADTFGTAASALARIPVAVRLIRTGANKRLLVASRQPVIAIGNGSNDAPMLAAATLGIAVIGPEGASAKALKHADVIMMSIGRRSISCSSRRGSRQL